MGSYKYVDGNGVLQDIINDFAISTDTGNKVTRGSDGGLFVANENSNFADAWNSTTLYTVGKLVIHNDILWKCLVQNTGEEPASGSTYWEQTSLDEIASGLNTNLTAIKSNEVKYWTPINCNNLITGRQYYLKSNGVLYVYFCINPSSSIIPSATLTISSNISITFGISTTRFIVVSCGSITAGVSASVVFRGGTNTMEIVNTGNINIETTHTLYGCVIVPYI